MNLDSFKGDSGKKQREKIELVQQQLPRLIQILHTQQHFSEPLQGIPGEEDDQIGVFLSPVWYGTKRFPIIMMHIRFFGDRLSLDDIFLIFSYLDLLVLWLVLCLRLLTWLINAFTPDCHIGLGVEKREKEREGGRQGGVSDTERWGKESRTWVKTSWGILKISDNQGEEHLSQLETKGVGK